MAKRKTDRAFEDWLRSLRLAPETVKGQAREVFRRAYDQHVAPPKTDFVRLLNATAFAQRRRDAGQGKVTTDQTLTRWIAGGCPENPDRTVSPIEVCAWLASERKETAGRPTAGQKAAGGGEGEVNWHELTDELRKLLDQGDVAGLIALLMTKCSDLPTAEAVSKITMNIIGAEKGRVKAQADEFERRLRSGELREAKDVEREQMEWAKFVRETLESLGSYAPRLQAKNLVELRQALEEIGGDLLRQLAGDSVGENDGEGEPIPAPGA